MLDDESFLNVINATPLISIDLVIRNRSGEVLLGQRLNRPAKGFWFVPGGRIRKDELLSQAFERLCQQELGLKLVLRQARLLGAYEHLYPDNFAGREGISTHYVVLAYEIRLEDEVPSVSLNDQHVSQAWWPVESIRQSDEVHANTRDYFPD